MSSQCITPTIGLVADQTPDHFVSTNNVSIPGSGKTEWSRKLLLTSLIHPPPERILWCFRQWQPLYEDLQKRIPWIEFVHGIPDYLNSLQFINPGKRNLIIFDDLMTEAKCEQRIADLFTKGSHHRNKFIVYLTQNVFPQGKACRDSHFDRY